MHHSELFNFKTTRYPNPKILDRGELFDVLQKQPWQNLSRIQERTAKSTQAGFHSWPDLQVANRDPTGKRTAVAVVDPVATATPRRRSHAVELTV